MMKPMRIAMLLVGALSLAACNEDDGVIVAPKVPLAYTRFVHAVPDTGATDWRFIDILENSPTAIGLKYRGFTPYQATAVGQHQLRIFTTSTDINVTSVPIIDEQVTLAPNTYYTIVHVGFARNGQTPADRLLVIEDKIPDVATGNVAVRAVNLATGLGNVDVFASAAGGTTPLPSSPLFANVAYLAATAYSNLTPGPLALRVTRAGQTAVMADVVAPAGEAANPGANLSAVGGSSRGGSAFTAFAFPRSVAGSSAPQETEFGTPSIVYIIDRHPR
jgi:hypothetical protein